MVEVGPDRHSFLITGGDGERTPWGRELCWVCPGTPPRAEVTYGAGAARGVRDRSASEIERGNGDLLGSLAVCSGDLQVCSGRQKGCMLAECCETIAASDIVGGR